MTKLARWLLSGAMLSLLPGVAGAVDCRDVRFEADSYTLCEVRPARDDLRLFLSNPETDAPFGTFGVIDAYLKEQGERLFFAMNAGMYHADRRPVGLYLENGAQVAPLITADGPGNFGLLPNGVFCVGEGRADVIESKHFHQTGPECRYASQSGPMLVIDGKLHPRFLTNSNSRYIRNGVGTSADGEVVYFVISRNAVNFHTFGRFFRDALKVPQALYFDGNISRLYAPQIGRNDLGFPMGPIVGVVVPSGDVTDRP